MCKMKNAIFFGNGFNLLTEGALSWHDLLIGISDGKKVPLLDGIPPTLQYEQVYISPKTAFSDSSDEGSGLKLKKAVKKETFKASIQ